MVNIETIKKEFEERGYSFYQSIGQFQKIVVYDNGIKYCLTWYFHTENCHIFGEKDTYYCMMITGDRIKIEFSQEVLNIEDIENKANQLYTNYPFTPFQDFNQLR